MISYDDYWQWRRKDHNLNIFVGNKQKGYELVRRFFNKFRFDDEIYSKSQIYE